MVWKARVFWPVFIKIEIWYLQNLPRATWTANLAAVCLENFSLAWMCHFKHSKGLCGCREQCLVNLILWELCSTGCRADLELHTSALWVLILALLLIGCVTWGTWLNFSHPYFVLCKMKLMTLQWSWIWSRTVRQLSWSNIPTRWQDWLRDTDATCWMPHKTCWEIVIA